MHSLLHSLKNYGANPDAILAFAQEGPALLPYATLLCTRTSGSMGDPDLVPLLGVYEWQDSPLIFLADSDALTDELHFRRLRRKLALRGDAPYLGIIHPGRFTVFGLSLDEKERKQCEVSLNDVRETPRLTVAYLAGSRPDAAFRQRTWIADVVLTLLRDAIRALKDSGLALEDAISLAGRALFVRFLGDRDLIPLSELGEGASGELVPEHREREKARFFENQARAKATSIWLDETFNGDLLPISETVFDTLSSHALKTLSDILYRAPKGQLYLGWDTLGRDTKWGFLDFAHIPVGVLSQAYEQHMREHLPDKQHVEGAYYTPRRIAELMVTAAFHPLRREGRAHLARVLDPAAGAGVFLLAAFRQLVAERWTHDGVRPDTATLRHILYHQLVGFDINEGALRFAALGLYLMSIELDPQPEPVSRLRFEHNLRDRVLFKFGPNAQEGGKKLSPSLGSLGKAVPATHAGQYDLVIGNPPWTTGTKHPKWLEVKTIVQRVAASRLLGASPSALLPNECLDLPFVWRAMEWARPEGQIAFALHGRLLFQQGDGMPEARLALFQALDITGLINGAELRKTKVWPEITAPFCLMWAKNRLPQPASAFRFVSPHLEPGLHNAGVLRIDAASAEQVTVSELAARPELFKILFRGSRLDLEILERMAGSQFETLSAYWGRLFKTSRGKPKQTGNGYQRLRESSEKKKGAILAGVDASYLHGLKELNHKAMSRILIKREMLEDFDLPRIHRKRPREIFEGPLLVVHESPPAANGRVRTSVSQKDLLYNQSYNGYSATKQADGGRLVQSLSLLIGSKPALWWVLMTSGRFGVEREAVEKHVIDSMPIVPLDTMSRASYDQIDALFQELLLDDSEPVWRKVDAWAASLYGLRADDLQVIEDTLSFNLPFTANVARANARPGPLELRAFGDVLVRELGPWVEGASERVEVDEVDVPSGSPWCLLRVRGTGAHIPPNPPLIPTAWQAVLQLADGLGSTELVWSEGPGQGLWIARLAQARYWSHSQAVLLSRRIVWEHLDSLFGQGET